jgi:hypothetical protein
MVQAISMERRRFLSSTDRRRCMSSIEMRRFLSSTERRMEGGLDESVGGRR